MRCLTPPTQRINLHRDEQAAPAIPLSAVSLTRVAGLGLLAILLGWGWVQWQTFETQAQYRHLHAQVQQRQQQLAAIRAGLPSGLPDPGLQRDASKLEHRRTSLQKAIALISSEQRREHRGFSDILHGLAAQPLDQLWLRDIHIDDKSHRISLRGMTLEPAAVPRMLQTLGTNPAFHNLSFGRAQFRRDDADQQGPMSFELASHPAKEQGDG